MGLIQLNTRFVQLSSDKYTDTHIQRHARVFTMRHVVALQRFSARCSLIGIRVFCVRLTALMSCAFCWIQILRLLAVDPCPYLFLALLPLQKDAQQINAIFFFIATLHLEKHLTHQHFDWSFFELPSFKKKFIRHFLSCRQKNQRDQNSILNLHENKVHCELLNHIKVIISIKYNKYDIPTDSSIAQVRWHNLCVFFQH